ncbi:MAG TPA: glucose 1-dehydrogenase [Candidatus Limnocylindrales bacterium]
MGNRFEGKVAIVTGAGSGLGESIALAFANEQAAVVVADLNGQRAEAVVDEIVRAGGQGFAVVADISTEAGARRMADATVDRFGRLDILVNNAGIRSISPFLDQKLSDWQRTIDVMLTGPMLCSQASIPYMLRVGKGKIVNVASVTGIIALTKRAAYTAAKAGLIGLTKQLAFELSSQGIYVNAVAPGLMETPMNVAYLTDPQFTELTKRELPLGRWGKPEEIANVVLFLASPESDFVCGACWTVDGGWTSGKGY